MYIHPRFWTTRAFYGCKPAFCLLGIVEWQMISCLVWAFLFAFSDELVASVTVNPFSSSSILVDQHSAAKRIATIAEEQRISIALSLLSCLLHSVASSRVFCSVSSGLLQRSFPRSCGPEEWFLFGLDVHIFHEAPGPALDDLMTVHGHSDQLSPVRQARASAHCYLF